jgi:hypothetical protein
MKSATLKSDNDLAVPFVDHNYTLYRDDAEQVPRLRSYQGRCHIENELSSSAALSDATLFIRAL